MSAIAARATQHRFAQRGHYVVRVERTNAQGQRAIAHLPVRVEPEGSGPANWTPRPGTDPVGAPLLAAHRPPADFDAAARQALIPVEKHLI
jgi:hypothetical protein